MLTIQLEFRLDNRDALETHIDTAVFIGNIGDDLEADPQTAEARQAEAQQAQIKNLLRAARVEDRHQRVVKRHF